MLGCCFASDSAYYGTWLRPEIVAVVLQASIHSVSRISCRPEIEGSVWTMHSCRLNDHDGMGGYYRTDRALCLMSVQRQQNSVMTAKKHFQQLGTPGRWCCNVRGR